VFFTFHPEGNKGDIELAELVDGQVRPYPSAAFQNRFTTILSVRIDRQGRLWTLDYGNFGLKRPRLFAIDLATGELDREYEFPTSAAPIGSMLNDFRVSSDGKTIYISDPSNIRGKPAIVVVDMDREHPIARRRLVRHHSVEDGPYDVFVDGEAVKFGPILPRYGVDGLALDAAEQYLYYASLNTGELYRVRTDDLRYEVNQLLDGELGARVEKVADVTMTDGMAADGAGNVYLTDMEHSAIVRVDAGGQLAVVARDPRLRWPDGLAWGPDGALYVTASSLHLVLPELIRGRDDIAEHAPYNILKLYPDQACGWESQCVGTPGD
jgi:sugar lactone lactonase YvrE